MVQCTGVLRTENVDEECDDDEFEDYSDDAIDGVDSIGPSLMQGIHNNCYHYTKITVVSPSVCPILFEWEVTGSELTLSPKAPFPCKA